MPTLKVLVNCLETKKGPALPNIARITVHDVLRKDTIAANRVYYRKWLRSAEIVAISNLQLQDKPEAASGKGTQEE